MDAPRRRHFLERGAVPQAPVERALQEGVLVEPGEDFGDGGTGDGARHADRLELAQRPPAAVMLEVRLGAGAGEGRPPIVERALEAEPHDRGVDRLVLELPAAEPLPHLRLGQLAPGEHLQPRDVGTVDVFCH